jgi:putative sterol carrier protein
MSDLTIHQIMTRMPEAFVPEKAGNTAAVIQFHFTGADPSDWFAAIAGGACRTEPGRHAAPDMTMTVDSADYVALIAGSLNPMSAFMQGKLKLQGDMSLAMKLTTYFEKPA